MFNSSNPFGQPSSSPFGSQSGFGQSNNTSNNPFAPNPFGTSTPFGAQTGSSMFASTSTGVFGAPQASSPFSSSTTFGASPGFGSSTPAFGASSSPAFGSSASPFGGTSAFGQKPFGFSTPQSSPFGSSTPFGATSTPAFGATSTPAFGATGTPAFGATSTPAFGTTSTPAFGATNTPAFGATNTPAFGATNTTAFGASSSPAFGATNTPAFGASSAPAFGASSTPAFGSAGNAFGNNAFGSGGGFGASSTPAFGASSTPAFGASNTPAFGASNTSAFGASSTPAFGASSTPSFSFGSSPAFGQSTSSFGSGSFGSTPSPFGTPNQGAQASTPTFGGSGFGQSTFGGQQGGSRVVPFAPTTETEANGTQPAGKLESIAAMPAYKDKNHEELRWEDYQRGDKGGQLPGGQSSGGAGFGLTTSQPNAFAPAPAFGQTSANPTNAFSSSSGSNLFGQKPTGFGMTTSNFGSSPFGATTSSNPFGSTTSYFGSSPSFGTTTSSPLSSTPAFGSSPSLFGSSPAQGSTPAFGSGQGFASSQAPSLFSTPSTGQPSSIFGANSAFGQTSSTFGQFGQNTNSTFGQTNNFGTPSTGFGGNMFSSSSSLTTSNNSPFGLATPAAMTPYQSAQPAQSGAFGFNNFGSTQTGNATGFTGFAGQNNFGQGSASSIPLVLQPVPVTNPFGTLPVVPQISIGQDGTASTIRYGISSMPIVDKPAPVRISSVLTSRHLFHRRGRPPLRKYRPGVDGLRVPFFSDESEPSSTPKADAQFMPRENPRALFIRPYERKKLPSPKDGQAPVHENGKSSDGEVTNGANHNNKDKAKIFEVGEQSLPPKANQKPNGTHTATSSHQDGSYNSPNGHKLVAEQETDIEALLPKLHHGDYYTEPRIQELAAKERVDPGYCSRVKDFVIGRHGYGSIKFLGETDVRGLDLESLVQFNKKEVIVYMDESDKPPVGEGLNKPAEVTLLNIKYLDKKTGKQIMEGERMEKYKEMLKRKAEEQGAEFVSYDAVKGEWKFSVKHFSSYKLGDDDELE